jgi:hypothetical protein
MLNAGHGAGFTVIVMLLSDVCAPPAQLSVALTVKVDIPADDGVPVISPDALMLNPDCNVPDTMLKITGACPPDVAI